MVRIKMSKKAEKIAHEKATNMMKNAFRFIPRSSSSLLEPFDTMHENLCPSIWSLWRNRSQTEHLITSSIRFLNSIPASTISFEVIGRRQTGHFSDRLWVRYFLIHLRQKWWGAKQCDDLTGSLSTSKQIGQSKLVTEWERSGWSSAMARQQDEKRDRTGSEERRQDEKRDNRIRRTFGL